MLPLGPHHRLGPCSQRPLCWMQPLAHHHDLGVGLGVHEEHLRDLGVDLGVLEEHVCACAWLWEAVDRTAQHLHF